MKESFKCPFCEGEMLIANEMVCVCGNDKCRAWGNAYPKFILQALIDGKAAQDALKIARTLYVDLVNEVCGLWADEGATVQSNEYLSPYDKKINEITKQENE